MIDREKLLKQFERAMRDLYNKERDVVGKPDNSFSYLMDQYGELEAAKLMLRDNEHLAGFTRLAYGKTPHPELTVEYLVWNSPADGYRSLFEPIHIENAGRRLRAIQ